jgi:hypothetical protein
MVEVPCGEVVFFDTIINNVEVIKEKLVNKLVKVPCKPCYNRVDTIYKDKFISYENTALIGVKDDVIDSLTVTSIEAVKDAKDWRKSTYKLIALLSLLVMIPIGYKLIKLKYG